MRIRRKKHLKERIEAVSDLLFIADYSVPDSREAIKNKTYFDFNKIYINDNPVDLEIGCGKGGFVCGMATRHPERNYLAVELLDNIIVMAVENCVNHGLSNVRFFNCGAEYLPKYICNKSISNLYLNFSPPFPGDRYENRRLTNSRLVGFYKDFLTIDGVIHLKTDNKDFFDYSFSQFVKFGFDVVDTTSKVKSGEVENVVTEYEKKFMSEKLPIYYLIAKNKTCE